MHCNEMLVNDVQSENTFDPIFVTVAGIIILGNSAQLENVLSLIIGTVKGQLK